MTHIWKYVVYFLAWLLLSIPGFWFLLSLSNQLFTISVLLQLNPWAVRAINSWSMYIFGAIWFVAIFTIEGYLRSAIAKNRLWPRIRRVVIIELVIAAGLLFLDQTIKFVA